MQPNFCGARDCYNPQIHPKLQVPGHKESYKRHLQLLAGRQKCRPSAASRAGNRRAPPLPQRAHRARVLRSPELVNFPSFYRAGLPVRDDAHVGPRAKLRARGAFRLPGARLFYPAKFTARGWCAHHDYVLLGRYGPA